ncbi:hypothetical protein [Streptomyces sp. NPDC001843]|uniref:hypothetical protein n=1 Tax=Streptomyces sp. NPDC001843 TaxID=3364617 RepID=UPI003699FF3B
MRARQRTYGDFGKAFLAFVALLRLVVGAPGAGPGQLPARQLVCALLLVGATAAGFRPGLSVPTWRDGVAAAG